MFSLFSDLEYTFLSTLGLSLFCSGSVAFLIPLLCLSTKGRKVQDTTDKRVKLRSSLMKIEECRQVILYHQRFIFSFISILYPQL